MARDTLLAVRLDALHLIEVRPYQSVMGEKKVSSSNHLARELRPTWVARRSPHGDVTYTSGWGHHRRTVGAEGLWPGERRAVGRLPPGPGYELVQPLLELNGEAYAKAMRALALELVDATNTVIRRRRSPFAAVACW